MIKIISCRNHFVADFTFLRYLTLALYYAYQTRKLQYQDQYKTTLDAVRGFICRGIEFSCHDGIGITIYFATSASMDNFAIWFSHGNEYCKGTILVAVYTMALITFLPNSIIGSKYQQRYFIDANNTAIKIIFVLSIMMITMFFFMVRMIIVYEFGWINFIDSCMKYIGGNYAVLISCVTPPLVDFIQAKMLQFHSARSSLHYGEKLLPESDPA